MICMFQKEESAFIRKVYFIDRVRVASDLAQEWISIRWNNLHKTSTIKGNLWWKQKAEIWNTFGIEQKYTISTIIYTYEDKPDNYLHCSRSKYVQIQEKQTETHRNSCFFKKQLKPLWVNWPKVIGVNLAEIQGFLTVPGCWKLLSYCQRLSQLPI